MEHRRGYSEWEGTPRDLWIYLSEICPSVTSESRLLSSPSLLSRLYLDPRGALEGQQCLGPSHRNSDVIILLVVTQEQLFFFFKFPQLVLM